MLLLAYYLIGATTVTHWQHLCFVVPALGHTLYDTVIIDIVTVITSYTHHENSCFDAPALIPWSVY
jgi:hypothetical protein